MHICVILSQRFKTGHAILHYPFNLENNNDHFHTMSNNTLLDSFSGEIDIISIDYLNPISIEINFNTFSLIFFSFVLLVLFLLRSFWSLGLFQHFPMGTDSYISVNCHHWFRQWLVISAYVDYMDLDVCCPRKAIKFNHSLTPCHFCIGKPLP